MALLICQSGAADDMLVVGRFSSLDPAGGLPASWQPLSFPKIKRHTAYSVTRINGRSVIQAHSNDGASGLIRHIRIDPVQYPWLVWRWRVERAIEKGDVTTRQGDDCAARIYVAFEFVEKGKTLWERLKHKAACVAAGRQLPGSALTYVWANKAATGTILDSPYTSHSKVVVVRTGKPTLSRWMDEKRNIADDYMAAFGTEPPSIVGVAIMTDTDNTGESTTAYYGDIWVQNRP